MLRYQSFKSIWRHLSTMASESKTPVEDILKSKITTAFQPTRLEIYNDSYQHAHHQAMKGNTSKETHFRIYITSEAFKSKVRVARHKMVYSLLKEELDAPGGVHALQLRTLTPEEERQEQDKLKEELAKEQR